MKSSLSLIILCGLNLLYMHYSVLSASGITFPWDFVSVFDNISGILFDLFVLFLISFLLTFRRIKPALMLCFIITTCWAFSNVVYARFFYMYIPLSVFQEADSLFDNLVIRSILTGIEVYDVYFLVAIPLFIYLYRKTTPTIFTTYQAIFKSTLFLISAFTIVILLHGLYSLIYMPSLDVFIWRINERHYTKRTHMLNPNYSTFSRGIMRTKYLEISDFIHGDEDIPEEVIVDIKSQMKDQKGKISNLSVDSPQKNIIMIVIESFMSFSLGRTVNGQEVTPFLNSLMHDEDVYYNGNMTPNITIGQSSDGQYIYMTGLLPLRSTLTISEAKNKTIPALPKILKNKGYVSRIIIPTSPSIWSQDKMSKRYGFDTMLSIYDYNHGSVRDLNDSQVFDIARNADKTTTQPFFSLILTLSTHEPYNRIIDKAFNTNDSSLSPTMQCYLNACHYTDYHISKYIDFLKRQHIFENSVIVILADHHVRNNKLEMAKDMNTMNIPLFIVNSGLKKYNGWHNECNQIDVFTTLTDIFNLDTEWRGLGCSLFSEEYSNTITENEWNMSEWIIKGNYFYNHEDENEYK